jgi:acyl-[acyl-carrier-protein]-phospholipid O-acyltransferase / long-chain-fatty-acid--[acyl-carrier-protein] ligase
VTSDQGSPSLRGRGARGGGLGLLQTRRLWPLALTQSCGAVNDNLVKNAMVVLGLFQLGIGGTGLSALAGALFIAPYVLLSATAGQLADRFAKPRVIVAYKLAEVLLMAAAAAALLTESVPGLLVVLTGLGIQATLFGPVKYGVLPEHLADDELVAGNGVIEATTFLSIVAGTVAGGALILLPHGTAWVSLVGLTLAVLGLWSAMQIPAVPPADPSLHISPNIIGETWRITRHAASVRTIWFAVLSLSWFWTMGATLMTEFPVIARDTLHSDGTVLTLLLTVFAVGVGVGSMQSARLLRGDVSARLVPFAGIGISMFCWDFASAASSAGTIATAATALSTLAGWRMIIDLFLLAACGGVFSVPLYAIIQDRAAPTERARMVAANNIMNALFMVAGAAATAGAAAIGCDAPQFLRLAAVANLVVACWIMCIVRAMRTAKPIVAPSAGHHPAGSSRR